MQVRFENVTKSYGDFNAVKNLDLTIKSGALHFLLGPSGCGKTTSLRMLAGLETVTKGKIFFGDKDVTNLAATERGIGMVFQNYALWPHMTVYKNIEYGLKLRKLSKDEIKNRIDEVLDFTQLTRFVDRLPGQLSGGQQQRVALARALAIRPSMLLLDEPLSNLDAKLRLEMRENIVRIHKKTGITTLYVTHDQKESLSMGTHISVMHSGSLIQTSTPKGLYHRPATPFIANFIGETNFMTGVYKGVADNKRHIVMSEKFGELQCGHCEPNIKEGDPVTVSLRPEALKLHFDGNDKKYANTFESVLSDIIYLGESEQFMMDHEGVSLKSNVFHSPEHSYKEGDTILCSAKPSDMIILKPDENLGAGT